MWARVRASSVAMVTAGLLVLSACAPIGPGPAYTDIDGGTNYVTYPSGGGGYRNPPRYSSPPVYYPPRPIYYQPPPIYRDPWDRPGYGQRPGDHRPPAYRPPGGSRPDQGRPDRPPTVQPGGPSTRPPTVQPGGPTTRPPQPGRPPGDNAGRPDNRPDQGTRPNQQRNSSDIFGCIPGQGGQRGCR